MKERTIHDILRARLECESFGFAAFETNHKSKAPYRSGKLQSALSKEWFKHVLVLNLRVEIEWVKSPLAFSRKLCLAFGAGKIDSALALWYAQCCFACGACKELIILSHLEAVLSGNKPIPDRIGYFQITKVLVLSLCQFAGKSARIAQNENCKRRILQYGGCGRAFIWSRDQNGWNDQ